MLVADCLSRTPLNDPVEDNLNLTGLIHSLTRQVCMSEDNYNLYVEILNNDECYTRVCRYVQTDWPSYHQLDDLSQKSYKYKDELHYEQNLLFKDHRLVISTELQVKICKWLHAPHMGIEKTLACARAQFFWPRMTNDITEIVKNWTLSVNNSNAIIKRNLSFRIKNLNILSIKYLLIYMNMLVMTILHSLMHIPDFYVQNY